MFDAAHQELRYRHREEIESSRPFGRRCTRSACAPMLVLFWAPSGPSYFIASANLANLFIRGSGGSRRWPSAQRLAPGMGRLARQVLAESVVLAFAPSVAGTGGDMVDVAGAWWHLYQAACGASTRDTSTQASTLRRDPAQSTLWASEQGSLGRGAFAGTQERFPVPAVRAGTPRVRLTNRLEWRLPIPLVRNQRFGARVVAQISLDMRIVRAPVTGQVMPDRPV